MSKAERAQLQAMADAEPGCFEHAAINVEGMREGLDDDGDSKDSAKDEEFVFDDADDEKDEDLDDEKDEDFVRVQRYVGARWGRDARYSEYGAHGGQRGAHLQTAYMAYTAKRLESEGTDLSKQQIAKEWTAMTEQQKSRFGPVVAVRRRDGAMLTHEDSANEEEVSARMASEVLIFTFPGRRVDSWGEKEEEEGQEEEEDGAR
jgi:hypothetical protein